MNFLIRTILFSIFFVGSASPILAQGVIIGLVQDDKTNEGLPGVNVQIEKTVLGASTNLQGAFIIRKVPVGIYTLKISMIGFRNIRISNVNVIPGDTAVVKVRLQETPIEIDPVVVTVSKWKQDAKDTPAAIEVLTAKDIMQRSPLRIEDALETAAGVQILQENISIRGSDGFTLGIGSRVLVMMDGVPIMTSDMGSVNWFMVSPADIERAEIVRGAGSAVYGSSAMGGVVNFITRTPGPKPRTYVRTMAGIYDDFSQSGWDWTDDAPVFNRVDFTHSQQINNLDVRLSGGQSFSKGYTQNSSYTRYNFSGKIGYRFPDNSKLTLFGNYMHDDSEVFVSWGNQSEATKVATAELGKEQTRNGITVFAKYSRPIASNATVEFRGYFNRFLLGIQFTDVNFAPALGLGGAIQGFYLPWKNLSLIWGADFKRDQTKSDVYGERNAWLVAPFLQAEWQFHRNFNLTLGARYDRYDIPATSDTTVRLNKGQVFEHFSPKIGINYHPFENTTLRGSVSNGFKFPAIFQLFFDNQEITNITFVANDSLRSEKAWSYEVGLRQKISPTWFVEVNGFYTNVADLIEAGLADAATLKAAFLNTEDVAIPGVEFVSNGRWWDNRLGLRVNLTYLNPHNKRTNQLLTHRQKFIAFVGASIRLGNSEVQADYKYGSKQERYLFPGEHQFVPQKVLDTRFFYYWKYLTFMVGVNNVFNYAYTLRDRFLEENRNFVVGLNANF